MALPDRTKRLNQVGANPDVKINAMTQAKVGSYKIGDDTSYFMYVDDEGVKLQSPGAAVLMTKEGSQISPGKAMTVNVPFTKWQFQTEAFHTLSREPSTAVLPVPTVQTNYAQQAETAEFISGTLNLLKEAAAFFSGGGA
jgi:hypothetical protein